MTNAISAELDAFYAAGGPTIARIVKMTRRDGLVLAVTLDHDQDITFEAVTYKPVFGMSPSTVETSSSLNVDNLDAKGALLALGINAADIDAGLWDLCDVRVMRVNWADLTMGAEKIKRGNFGEISIGRGTFSNEIRGITQKLAQTLGDVVSPSCNADLGDTRCGIEMVEGSRKFSGVAVSTIVAAQRAFTASGLTQTAGFFDGGKVTWTTGLNTGLSKEIKTHTAGGHIELQEPMPYSVAITDQGTFFTGCLKRFTEDCLGKFNNAPRFRGFPSIPGQDQMFKGV
jgi:uncharacterized phage protein (TIGR02218 family)